MVSTLHYLYQDIIAIIKNYCLTRRSAPPCVQWKCFLFLRNHFWKQKKICKVLDFVDRVVVRVSNSSCVVFKENAVKTPNRKCSYSIQFDTRKNQKHANHLRKLFQCLLDQIFLNSLYTITLTIWMWIVLVHSVQQSVFSCIGRSTFWLKTTVVRGRVQIT